MTEKKRSLSMAKLGKLFGVSSSNLTQIEGATSNSASNTSLSSTTFDPNRPKPQFSLNGPQNSAKAAVTDYPPPMSPSSPELSEVSDSNVRPIKTGISSVNTSTKSPSLSPINSQQDLFQPKPVHGEVPSKYIRSPPTSRSNSIKKNGSSTNLARSNSSTPAPKPRFKMLESGNHEHNLRSAKRQEKLSNMLKDLLGAKKLRDEAKSALPNINEEEPHQPPTLFQGLVSQVKSYAEPVPSNGSNDCRSFVEKYGRCQEVIGKGAYGVVRISHKKVSDSDKDYEAANEVLYAVKEFKKKTNESEKKYNRRLTSEFCISSSLKHLNIIQTLDLLKDAKGDFVEVMEFCSGGDLYTLIIANGKLEYAEADCFFKQLIKGVNYMHDMGVAHRDLKPENLLLTQNGVLKITDFGNSECFKMAWESQIQYSEGVAGSSPYIAPEEFTSTEFDPRCVDIWSCGVIYMAMRTGRQLWSVANQDDEFFQEYLVKRKNSTGYEPIENLKRARCRNVIYSILDPKPSRRITGKQILNSEWGREIKLCEAGQGLLNTTEQI